MEYIQNKEMYYSINQIHIYRINKLFKYLQLFLITDIYSIILCPNIFINY